MAIRRANVGRIAFIFAWVRDLRACCEWRLTTWWSDRCGHDVVVICPFHLAICLDCHQYHSRLYVASHWVAVVYTAAINNFDSSVWGEMEFAWTFVSVECCLAVWTFSERTDVTRYRHVSHNRIICVYQLMWTLLYHSSQICTKYATNVKPSFYPVASTNSLTNMFNYVICL